MLGDGITDDILIRIAHFLPTARNLLCLGLTCPRFAAKIIAANRRARRRGGWGSVSAGDAVDRGGGGTTVGGRVQRVGAWLGASA